MAVFPLVRASSGADLTTRVGSLSRQVFGARRFDADALLPMRTGPHKGETRQVGIAPMVLTGDRTIPLAKAQSYELLASPISCGEEMHPLAPTTRRKQRTEQTRQRHPNNLNSEACRTVRCCRYKSPSI